MRHEMTKAVVTLLVLASLTPQMAAQCQAVKNTGSIASPSSGAGRCVAEGGYCYLVGRNQDTPYGKCASSGGPGDWSCACSTNGVVSSYFALNPGALTTFSSPPSTATALIGVLSVNGFSGSLKASCRITAAPINTNPSCSLSPSSQTVDSSGGLLTLTVPIQGLIPGNYTVEVDASTGTPPVVGDGSVSVPSSTGYFGPSLNSNNPPSNYYRASTSLGLSIPEPKASGGTPLALICFAVLLMVWSWRHNERMRRSSRL